MSMKVLDLFSGIGGFSLGLERAGMRTVGFCEIEPWCRARLTEHWPGVPIHGDIRELDGTSVGPVDLVCGGFPCQDISVVGTGQGLEGQRSGLWFEMLRIVRECRPDWLLVENSPRLRILGADRVLGGLEEIGYTGRPFVVEARHTGARHRRARVFIVANSDRVQLRQQPGWRRGESREGSPLARADGTPRIASNSDCITPKRPSIAWQERRAWPDESPVLGMDDDFPDWMDAKKALGNSVMPAITERIGRAIKLIA